MSLANSVETLDEALQLFYRQSQQPGKKHSAKNTNTIRIALHMLDIKTDKAPLYINPGSLTTLLEIEQNFDLDDELLWIEDIQKTCKFDAYTKTDVQKLLSAKAPENEFDKAWDYVVGHAGELLVDNERTVLTLYGNQVKQIIQNGFRQFWHDLIAWEDLTPKGISHYQQTQFKKRVVEALRNDPRTGSIVRYDGAKPILLDIDDARDTIQAVLKENHINASANYNGWIPAFDVYGKQGFDVAKYATTTKEAHIRAHTKGPFKNRVRYRDNQYWIRESAIEPFLALAAFKNGKTTRVTPPNKDYHTQNVAKTGYPIPDEQLAKLR